MSVDGNECQMVGSTNTFIECIPPEGQGNDIQVLVNVDGQETYATIAYKKPVINSIDPATGPTSGSIEGSPVNVTITGENFGTKGVIQILGGPTYIRKYDHQEITFLLPEGYGENVQVLLLPQGWGEAGTAKAIFSYELPSINKILSVGDDKSRKVCESFKRCISFNGGESCVFEYPDCFPTWGCAIMEAVGENFGPGEDWRNDPPEVTLAIEGHQGYVTSTKDSENPHTRLFFTLPEGTGENLLVQAIIEGRSSQVNVNNSYAISYDPPGISHIHPNKSNAAGDEIVIRGANFGPVGTNVEVTIGGSNCDNATVDRAHSVITCTTPPTTVGSKEIEINVRGRQIIFPQWLELLIAECKAGYVLKCGFCKKEKVASAQVQYRKRVVI